MREYGVPAISTVAPDESLTDMVWANAERFADAVAFRRRVDGTWIDVTTREFAAEVLAVAKGLIAAGVRPGDRVALMSRTRYEWTLVDFAVWAAGGVTVPVYETSSAEQVAWILADSGARAVVVEDDTHRRTVESVVDRLGEVVRIWQIEPGHDCAIEELTALGADLPDEDAHRRRRAVGSADLATLVYTSGTTGRPKGVELTHANLLAEIRADIAAFPHLLRPGNSMLVFLPLAHVFARAIALCCVYARTTLGHLPDVKTLVADLSTFRPTFVVAVPRVFEKVYNSARQSARAAGREQVFDIAEALAVEYSQAVDRGPVPLGLRIRHALAGRLVYSRLRAVLGGRCVAAISGSAPLGEHLAHFFRGVGVPVYEGYGLTETAAAVCVNTQAAFRVGTVGRPVAGARVAIAEDGEILLRGPMVSAGYWRGDRTGEWFATGDLGDLDADGYLRITGRKKELIVTAGGKNVAPAVLEDRVRRHPLVSQCLVVGDRRPFIAALVTLDPDFTTAWAAERGKSPDALAEDAELRAEIQTAVDEANKAVSQAESIRAFVVLPRDFTEEAGEVTPSLKLRRDTILKTYGDTIAAIYERR
ncbi:long-chain fatty acid--CoA ligase [Actinokineospora sp. UTMC 2448]|uniref:AMP-dependent synthetase/ligase n=1 Tax=Actinokineospora sp. UTMC 2448 TaxID=2268449 RepID=UPI0021648D42|nr:long-chain fatty acid--CoA ligase [Actinokineospora sp. UTMC 2448]UVS77861.1 Long-chain-fatty-acid--CoA ligase FadD15 [Actinokineospora sp. UTMC 2448]